MYTEMAMRRPRGLLNESGSAKFLPRRQRFQVGQNYLLVVVLEITGVFWAFVGRVRVAGGTEQAGGQGPGMPDILHCRG